MMFTLYGGKKDTISLRTGWLYNSMRMVMRWLRMQRLMSPIEQRSWIPSVSYRF